MTLFGIGISKQTVYNILRKNNISRKIVQVNKYPHSKERYEQELRRLRKEIKCRKERIISIDETAIQLDNVGRYGWSKKGKRCIIDKAHKNKGVRFSLLFGISKNKIVRYEIKEGTFKGIDFNSFMNNIHKVNGRYHYLLDNASIHRTKIMSKPIRNSMIYNVPYSPQFNPIEYVNNELKRQIYTNNIKNEKELRKIMERFVKENNKKGYKGYFKKAYKLLKV